MVENFGLSNGQSLTTQEIDGILLSCLKGLYIKHMRLQKEFDEMKSKFVDLNRRLLIVENK